MSNIAGIIPNDIAAAPGMCVSVFVSGCPLHCKGCHNPEMQNPAYGKPFTKETMAHILKLLHANGVHRDLCIMGGEPMAAYNADKVSELIDFIKAASPNTKIYVWSGYTLEELENCKSHSIRHILDTINCLVDGPFIQEERDITLPMRGSRNQKIIWLH